MLEKLKDLGYELHMDEEAALNLRPQFGKEETALDREVSGEGVLARAVTIS